MKLISMTDFVLELGKQTEIKTYAWYYLKVTKYATFLKQPLRLDMFIGENALFENYIIKDYFIYRKEFSDDIISIDMMNDIIIEDLIRESLTLTPYAIKQLGL